MSAVDVEPFKEDIRGREVSRDATVDKYARWARRFEAWRPGGEPDEGMLRDFDSFLADEAHADYPWSNARGPDPPVSYAHRSRRVALSAVKHWVRHQHGTRIEAKVQNLAVGDPDEFDPAVLEQSEVQQTINRAAYACDNPDCQTAIAVGHDAILRGAELADARVEDIDRDEQGLYVRAKKGSEPTVVPLGNDAWRRLSNFTQQRSGREYLFHNAYDRPWTAAAWNNHFRRKHHPEGFHSFSRHTPVTLRLKQGEPFGSVYQRARHTHPSTTLRYAHVAGVEAPGWAGDA